VIYDEDHDDHHVQERHARMTHDSTLVRLGLMLHKDDYSTQMELHQEVEEVEDELELDVAVLLSKNLDLLVDKWPM
jgi:hypothetical protein